MTEQKYFPWQEGMPTGPDVDALLKQWPELVPGDRIPYEDVEKIVRVERDGHRWRSITNAWRKRLRERGVVIECEAGRAFYVATADQISAGTHAVLLSAGRKFKKHRTKLVLARPENDAQRDTLEHQARLMHAMERESRKHRMNILPPAPQQQARIAPPAAATGKPSD